MADTERQFEIKGKEVVLKPEEGTIEDGEFKVNKVKIKLNGSTHTVGLDEMQEWDEAVGTVMNYLALDQLEQKIEKPKLVDLNGDHTPSVGQDTKVFKATIIAAYHGVITSSDMEEFYGLENASSATSNASYQGYIKAVAKRGNTHRYACTAEGWKQILAHYGESEWKKVVEGMQKDLTDENDDSSRTLSDYSGER